MSSSCARTASVAPLVMYQAPPASRPTNSSTITRQPPQPVAIQKTGPLPFFAGGASAICGTGGAMEATLSDVGFWAALAGSLLIAGVAAYPVNRWLLARGKGHAVVHAHHSTSH